MYVVISLSNQSNVTASFQVPYHLQGMSALFLLDHMTYHYLLCLLVVQQPPSLKYLLFLVGKECLVGAQYHRVARIGYFQLLRL